MADQSSNTEAPPVPKKRSLFSKSAVAKVTEPEKPVEFFSRAKELFPQRLEEEEYRRQKKLVNAERKRSSTSAELKESTPPGGKKRRVSSQLEAYSSDSSANQGENEEPPAWNQRGSTQSTPGSIRQKSRSSSQQKVQTSPTTLSARYNRDLYAEKREAPKAIPSSSCITLSDSESESESESARTSLPVRKPVDLGENDSKIHTMHRRAKPPPVEDDPEMSDEEFPELVQQARERERLKAERLNSAKSFGEQNRIPDGAGLPTDDIFGTGPTSVSDLDPIIDILITSEMDGTKPLMVKRRLSQRLKEVRLSWCDKQILNGAPMAPSIRNTIFLTWRYKEIFDSTTCESLGLKLDGHGKIYSGTDGVNDGGRVHLEAWTRDSFEAYQKKIAARRTKEQDKSESEEAPEQSEAEQKLRLVMKAKDLEAFKLVVKPTTSIEKMIAAFRKARNVPGDKEISLHLDGDELEAESTAGGNDFEDMDSIEVHIR